MFNHLYNTAKRILSRSPSYQDRSSELRETPPTSHHLEVSMVTTRRGTETPGQDSAATPQSTGKRRALKREIEALDTPTAAKRQKRTTPRKKVVEEVESAKNEENAPESSEDTVDTIAVLPRTRSKDVTQEGKLPIRRRSSPQVVVDKLSPPSELEATEEAIADDAATPTQDAGNSTIEQEADNAAVTPTINKKTQDSPTPRAKRASGRKKPSHSEVKEAAEEIPSSSHESEQAGQAEDVASQPKKAHVRFGSEEPEETLEGTSMNAARPATQLEIADSENDDNASDSDEAPEVVTTSAAASKAAATQQDAERAQLAQQGQERQKREAREQRIATEQAEKRKREEKKAKKLAKQLAKQQEDDDDAVETSIEPPASLAKSVDLSGLLPTSLLSAIPDQRAPTPPQARPGKSEEELRREKLNRHIKFLERSEKGPKDVKKGKVSVAVLGQQNKVLPPKVNRNSRDVRETWLKGRQVDARKGKKGISGKMERRGFGQRGFLRGED
ncbi:hypothetical protein IQ06DRAFT_379900 [Phaeosphaeriaceae sp. SRC1lsM3a]|nr:hypothetical protein IQ06DRAFT_379900 [Stagonospora sp. SRC1lsM3a]